MSTFDSSLRKGRVRAVVGMMTDVVHVHTKFGKEISKKKILYLYYQVMFWYVLLVTNIFFKGLYLSLTVLYLSFLKFLLIYFLKKKHLNFNNSSSPYCMP